MCRRIVHDMEEDTKVGELRLGASFSPPKFPEANGIPMGSTFEPISTIQTPLCPMDIFEDCYKIFFPDDANSYPSNGIEGMVTLGPRIFEPMSLEEMIAELL